MTRDRQRPAQDGADEEKREADPERRSAKTVLSGRSGASDSITLGHRHACMSG